MTLLYNQALYSLRAPSLATKTKSLSLKFSLKEWLVLGVVINYGVLSKFAKNIFAAHTRKKYSLVGDFLVCYYN